MVFSIFFRAWICRHLRTILIHTTYKSFNNLNPQFPWNYFNFSTLPYELRKGNKVNFPDTRTCRYRINSYHFAEICNGIITLVMLKKSFCGTH